MKLLVDFRRFPRIYDDLRNMIAILFYFDFHISAEQFYDCNKQGLVKREKTINQQTMPCQMMAQISK